MIWLVSYKWLGARPSQNSSHTSRLPSLQVLWEIENFDFGSVSDDDFATRRLRIPFAVTSYSMPGLARDDEFVSANKPWKSKWYTDRTLRPSTLLSSNPAGVSDFTLGANGGDIPRESYLELDDGSKYSC